MRANERALCALEKGAGHEMGQVGRAIISLSCAPVYPVRLGNAMDVLKGNFSLILCPAEDISHLDSLKRMVCP